MDARKRIDRHDVAVASSNEAAEQGRATGSGGGGAKGGGQGEREPMPHVPDTVPGKRVTDAGGRTEGAGQPSNIRGGSAPYWVSLPQSREEIKKFRYPVELEQGGR